MKTNSFRISGTEALHIGISVITIAFAFTLFPAGTFTAERFLLILLTLGMGFVLHELGHKYVAIKYGALAEYRAWTTGLFAALVLAWITNGNFIFAAPGAVYIFGKAVSKEQNGRIAIAGAAVNLLLAWLFLLFGLAFPEFALLAGVGVYINAFLGFFNLIPIPPLDGSKVFNWNKTAWATTIALLFLTWIFNPFTYSL
jgi:Zn-dependent protease